MTVGISSLSAIRCLTSLAFALASLAFIDAQSAFPAPNALLQDVEHKEPPSGLSMQGGDLVIRSGVGTPTTINRLNFSPDGTLLAVAKDFGRVVVFDLSRHSVLRALDTRQGIVKSVAISPDNKIVAVAGDQDNGRVVLWSLADGKRIVNFDVELPVVQELRFLTNRLLFVKENGQPIYVVDVSDGHRIFEVEHEGWATFSGDGHLLITTSGDSFVVRSTSDFSVVTKFPKPSKDSFPAALSEKRNVVIAEDTFAKTGFVAMKLSDGTALPYKPLGEDLAANPSAGYFVGIDDETGIVYGHSQARLWAWDPFSGKVCATAAKYSEAGALSADGKTVASGVDNGFLSGKKNATGTEVWSTSKVALACELIASHATN